MTELDVSPPDELILVPDLETAGEAPKATKDSVNSGPMTTAAMYETEPVREALDCATPTD